MNALASVWIYISLLGAENGHVVVWQMCHTEKKAGNWTIL